MAAQSVNFFAPGTEAGIDAGQIMRQREMAKLLQQQGMTSPQGNMVSGHYVAPSPMAYVAQLVAALGGKYKENQADASEKALVQQLAAQRSKEVQDFMAAGQGTPAQPARDIQPLTPNDDEGSPMPAARADAVPAVAPDVNRQIAIAMQSQNPMLQGMGGKLIERQMDAADLQSALAAARGGSAAPDGGAGAPGGAAPAGGATGAVPDTMGVNPQAFALALSRNPQAQKLAGMVENAQKPMALAEGGTAYVPGKGAVFTAPKTEAGIGVQNGQAAPIPGFAEAQARREGLQAQARQGAESQNTIVTVKGPDGKDYQMTRAQAMQLVNGQQGAAPAGYANEAQMRGAVTGGDMGPAPGAADREIAALRSDLGKVKDAPSKALIQQEIDRLRGQKAKYGGQDAQTSPRAPGAPTMPGVAGEDPNAQQFGKTVATQSAEALMAGRDKAKTAADSLLTIEQARAAAKQGSFQGSGAEVKQSVAKFINSNVPGITIDPAKVANTGYLESTLGSALLEQAKTLGSNPSNADASRITAIVGSIGTDPGALGKMLDWREEMARRAVDNHNRTVKDAEGRGLRSPYDLSVTMPTAPGAATGFKILGVK